MPITRRTLLTHSLAVSASAGLILLPHGSAWAAARVGQPAPDFALPDTAGQTVKLSQFKGRTVVLEWLNPGCPFVRKHYSGNMQAVQRDATAGGAVWLAINSTDPAHGDYLAPADLQRWMQDKRAAATSTLMDEDGAVGRAYGARTTPQMFIVSPQGVLVYAGAIDSIPSTRVEDIDRAVNYVRQGLDELRAGKAISQAVSQPYGCSVKYRG